MKLNSDHRNSISRQMPAAGATIGIRISRERPPQARPPEFNFMANARRRRDRRNSISRQMPTAGATGGIPFHGNTHRRWGRPMVAPTFRSYSRFVQFPRPRGKHCPFAGEKKRGVRRKCRHRHTLIRARSVLRQSNLLLRMRPCRRHGRTSFVTS